MGRVDSSDGGAAGRIPADDAPIAEIVAFMKQLGAKPGMLGFGGAGGGGGGPGPGARAAGRGAPPAPARPRPGCWKGGITQGHALHDLNSVSRRIPADGAPIAEIVAFMKQLGAKPGMLTPTMHPLCGGCLEKGCLV